MNPNPSVCPKTTHTITTRKITTPKASQRSPGSAPEVTPSATGSFCGSRLPEALAGSTGFEASTPESCPTAFCREVFLDFRLMKVEGRPSPLVGIHSEWQASSHLKQKIAPRFLTVGEGAAFSAFVGFGVGSWTLEVRRSLPVLYFILNTFFT